MLTATIRRPRVRVIGGVCAGLAEHLGTPVTVVRTLTVIAALCGGAGVLLYAWLWAVTPLHSADRRRPLKSVLTAATVPDRSDRPGKADPDGRRAPVTEILLGLALVAAGSALVASRLGVGIPLTAVIPTIVVLVGVALAWAQFAGLRQLMRPTPSDQGNAAQRGAVRNRLATPTRAVRTLGSLVLVATGILLFFVTGESPNVWTVIAAAITVLVGVGLVALPWIIRLAHDLTAERTARERDAERAEIAAHLHDSVLQTLALIQQKAGPQSESGRLARAQEHELREWLFADSDARAQAPDLAGELRRIAASIEQEHVVRFDVVAIGVSLPAPEAIAAAAREAMFNAARHAGGDVSVFLEVQPQTIELIVTDRGPGIAIEEIPGDRFGVRESILGRMTRAGGSATILPGRGGRGTAVTLRMPRSDRTQPEPTAETGAL